MSNYLWILWRLTPHNHGTDNMRFVEMYSPGEYEIWQCRKCKKLEAL